MKRHHFQCTGTCIESERKKIVQVNRVIKHLEKMDRDTDTDLLGKTCKHTDGMLKYYFNQRHLLSLRQYTRYLPLTYNSIINDRYPVYCPKLCL